MNNNNYNFKHLLLKFMIAKLILIYLIVLIICLFSTNANAQSYREEVVINPTKTIVKINNQDVCLRTVYRIQLMVLSQEPSFRFFHENTTLSKLHSNSNLWFLYSSSYYNTKEEASNAVLYYKKLGYKDCFVVKSYMYSLHDEHMSTPQNETSTSNINITSDSKKDSIVTSTIIIGDKDNTPVSYDNNTFILKKELENSNDSSKNSKKKPITVIDIPIYIKGKEHIKNE